MRGLIAWRKTPTYFRVKTTCRKSEVVDNSVDRFHATKIIRWISRWITHIPSAGWDMGYFDLGFGRPDSIGGQHP